ncbi:MAG: D-glycero-beta-D-manno-heptose 1,7-bisphosphate 7-phosphatase [Mucilaginibacter sp.]
MFTKVRKAVFLDRDGTINVEKNYLFRKEDWEWIPGSMEAICNFNKAGYLVIVISNQGGVARGKYSEEDIHHLHAYVDQELARIGAWIDAYYYCPHHPEYGDNRNCICRKPHPGMILRASDELGIDLSASYFVGDKIIDMEAALAAGLKPIMVKTGYGKYEADLAPAIVSVVENLFNVNIPKLLSD